MGKNINCFKQLIITYYINRLIIYSWTWSTIGDVESTPGQYKQSVYTNEGASVTWTCAYSSNVHSSTEQSAVDHTSITEGVSSSGDLSSSFVISLHETSDGDAPVSTKDRIIHFSVIGRG